MTQHVVSWSSGITSFGTALVVIEEHGRDNVTLLFADTKAEDEDNYRFNRDAERILGIPITVVADGRTPQQVNRDSRWLSNSRIAKCSHVLKQIPCRRWMESNCDPTDTVLYIGIDWTETHREPAITRNWDPWRVEFPLMRPPFLDKDHWLTRARALGLKPPTMYDRGYPHANCAGACVRGGQAQWVKVLDDNPALFQSWVDHEQDMTTLLGKEVAILRDRRGGVSKPLPLTVLRTRVQGAATPTDAYDEYDVGGCGCFTDVDSAPDTPPVPASTAVRPIPGGQGHHRKYRARRGRRP